MKLADLIIEYERLESERKTIEKQYTKAKKALAEQLRARKSKSIKAGGKTAVLKTVKRQIFDQKTFRENHTDMFEKYKKDSSYDQIVIA